MVCGETEKDRSPCQLQLPQCMNRRLKTRLTQGQFLVAAAACSNTDESPVTKRESFRRVRRGPKLCS